MGILIPKDKNYLVVLTNWRPKTLLNVDYKIPARLIANRIKSKLPTSIDTDQTGFVKGRLIGQYVRLLNNIMEYTEMNKIPGIMVFVDSEKGFDSLECHFIQNTLRFFDFGPNFRQWLSTLYCDVKSSVLNGGYMTKLLQSIKESPSRLPFEFPPLYSTCQNTYTKNLSSRNIQGSILPGSVEAKLSQFVDDTTLICEDVNSLSVNISVLNEFGKTLRP